MIEIHAWNEAQEQHDSLMACIARMRQKYRGCALATGTGWASPKVMQDLPEIEPFAAWAAETMGVEHARMHVWGNALQHGQQIGRHDHYQAIACGVYYLEPGEDCPIVFDSGPIYPEAGQLITFGPRDVHYVPAYEGTGERVSLSINLYEV